MIEYIESLTSMFTSPIFIYIGLLASISSLSCLSIILYYVIKKDYNMLKSLFAEKSFFKKYFTFVMIISFFIFLMIKINNPTF